MTFSSSAPVFSPSRIRKRPCWSWLMGVCALSSIHRNFGFMYTPQPHSASLTSSSNTCLYVASEPRPRSRRMPAGTVKNGVRKPRRVLDSTKTIVALPKHNNGTETLQTTNMIKPKDKFVRKGMKGTRYEMLAHDILSAEEEQKLGRKVRRAIELKEKMTKLVDTKRPTGRLVDLAPFVVRSSYPTTWSFDSEWEEEVFDSLFDKRSVLENFERKSLALGAMYSEENSDSERSGISTFELSSEDGSDFDFDSIGEFVEDASHDLQLTAHDIVHVLGVPGGRGELRRILIDGALARDKMIASNIRLVVSIAKKWSRRSGLTSGKQSDQSLTHLYAGSWTRPSLDEAIQEGILGLATAADRFDPDRKIKFGTYATYWITSFVRKCFQTAATGVLRVPTNYHVMKQNYNKIVMRYWNDDGTSPSIATVAEEMNVNPKQLEFVLKTTQSPLSIDAPTTTANHRKASGGKAGTDLGMVDEGALLGNFLPCTEPRPEDQVERSLLRQCLENAMATELSPHERDVLRLRHGLDDGVSRTAREVVEICGGALSLADVRLAEVRAFRKLRSPYSVHTYHLVGFLDYVGAETEATLELKRGRQRSPSAAR